MVIVDVQITVTTWGNEITFDYDTTNAHLVDTVTDTEGRVLTFTRNGSLQVTDFGAMGQSMGIRGMWTNVTALGDHHHVLPLEDDIEVSPLYYWWLLFAAARWGPFGDAELALRTRRMVGVSLYTPRLVEVRMPRRRIDLTGTVGRLG